MAAVCAHANDPVKLAIDVKNFQRKMAEEKETNDFYGVQVLAMARSSQRKGGFLGKRARGVSGGRAERARGASGAGEEDDAVRAGVEKVRVSSSGERGVRVVAVER